MFIRHGEQEAVDSSATCGAAPYMWLVKSEEICAVTVLYKGHLYGPILVGEAQDPMRPVRAVHL